MSEVSIGSHIVVYHKWHGLGDIKDKEYLKDAGDVFRGDPEEYKALFNLSMAWHRSDKSRLESYHILVEATCKTLLNIFYYEPDEKYTHHYKNKTLGNLSATIDMLAILWDDLMKYQESGIDLNEKITYKQEVVDSLNELSDAFEFVKDSWSFVLKDADNIRRFGASRGISDDLVATEVFSKFVADVAMNFEAAINSGTLPTEEDTFEKIEKAKNLSKFFEPVIK